jgi:hypothetical protein
MADLVDSSDRDFVELAQLLEACESQGYIEIDGPPGEERIHLAQPRKRRS